MTIASEYLAKLEDFRSYLLTSPIGRFGACMRRSTPLTAAMKWRWRTPSCVCAG